MASSPNGILSRFRKIFLLFILAGTMVLLIAPVSAETGVTINARGDQSYYLGEEVVLTGSNNDSDITYLFITGPGISPDGGKLSSPFQNITSGDASSFNHVQTNPDKTWNFTLYTYDLGINPGPYTIHAVSRPKTAAQVTAAENKSVRIIFKKPFITAGITPSTIIQGQPFTVTGYAEGNPETVQVWIIGDHYVFNATIPAQPDQSYRFTSTAQFLNDIPKGQCYLIVQHPMQNNHPDIVASGEYVKNLQLSSGNPGGVILFKIAGPGSLQGHDAAEALIAALNDPVVDDTYTEIPLYVVNHAGVPDGVSFSGTAALPAEAPPATPVQTRAQASPLQVAPIGALALIAAIVMLSRH